MPRRGIFILEGSRRAVAVGYGVMVAANAMANMKSPLLPRTNPELSQLNPTYATPQPLTFAIWPFIFVLQGIIAVQEFRSKGPVSSVVSRRRALLALSYGTNALWLFIFANEQYILSAVVMLIYLLALLQMFVNIVVQRKGDGSHRFLEVGISVNCAWIAVAAVLNIVITYARVRLALPPGAPLPKIAGSQLLVGATALCLTLNGFWLLTQRQHVSFSATLAWAFYGLCNQQQQFGAERLSKFTAACAALNLVGSLSLILWRVIDRRRNKNNSTEDVLPSRP